MKKEEKTELTRAKIFAAAIKEFGEKGYTAGSINNICKTGINKGLIYHNFKDKDDLYLECVKKSCEDFLHFVIANQAKEGFVAYMNARMRFFREQEEEACIFLEARINPPQPLSRQIQKIYAKLDELNVEIFEKELSRHELRKGVSKEEALRYFLEIQSFSQLSFRKEAGGSLSAKEQLSLHEEAIRRIFDFMLYGIAKGGTEK